MAHNGLSTAVAHRWRFLKRYLNEPTTVGAVGPSSRALAQALCEPYRKCRRPATVLEVGAGTGAVTRYLGKLLKEEDKLDVCEVEADFAEILARDVLTRAEFAPAVDAGRVRLLNLPVQDLTADDRYDFIISGLPFNAFPLRDVRDVFAVVHRSLKPGGVFSYFEYVGLRRASTMLAVGERRRRIRLVSAFLTKRIGRHQFRRRTVVGNFPPAHARYLRFDG